MGRGGTGNLCKALLCPNSVAQLPKTAVQDEGQLCEDSLWSRGRRSVTTLQECKSGCCCSLGSCRVPIIMLHPGLTEPCMDDSCLLHSSMIEHLHSTEPLIKRTVQARGLGSKKIMEELSRALPAV